MNLMILINLWLDINCQVTTKRATVSKPKLFHQLSTPYIWSIHFVLADSHTDVSGCKNYIEILCIILSSFSFGLFPMIIFSPLSIQLSFFISWHACIFFPSLLPLNFSLLGAINWNSKCYGLWIMCKTKMKRS